MTKEETRGNRQKTRPEEERENGWMAIGNAHLAKTTSSQRTRNADAAAHANPKAKVVVEAAESQKGREKAKAKTILGDHRSRRIFGLAPAQDAAALSAGAARAAAAAVGKVDGEQHGEHGRERERGVPDRHEHGASERSKPRPDGERDDAPEQYREPHVQVHVVV